MNIDIQIIGELFVAGISLGAGPCFAFCLPILFPYIISKETTAKEGFNISLYFSFGRILAYGALAFIAVYLVNTAKINNPYFKQVAGVMVVLMGVAYFAGMLDYKICAIINKWFVGYSRTNMFLLGVLVGLTPCVPLIACLTYILCKAATPYAGLVYGFVFGIGTLVSPVLLIGLIAGGLSRLAAKRQGMIQFLRVVSSLVLVYFGLKLII